MSQAFGGYTDEVIDVSRRTVFATLAVTGARAGHAGIVGAWEWWDPRSVQKDDGPDDSLRSERGGPVSEGQGRIQPDLALPPDSEENGLDGVQ